MKAYLNIGFTFAYIFALSCAYLPEGEQRNKRVIDGSTAQKNNYPFFFLLRLIWNQKEEAHCGSTLIDKEFLLTAAHCLMKNETKFAQKGNSSKIEFCFY